MGNSDRNELNDHTYQAKRDVAYERKLLVEAMRALAERLAREAGKLEADPTSAPNSLGEVQGSGHEIDRLCATLCEKRKLLETLVKCGGSSEKS